MAQNGGAIPHRFAALGGDQSIIVVDMPSMKEILKALAEEMQSDPSSDDPSSTEHSRKQADNDHVPSPQEVLGRTIPLLFIRSYDGVGYHSGRSITLENVFAQLDLGHGGPPPGMEAGWLNAASQAVGTELGGWTLRIL
jgi:recombining binding protein (suppressor of hairless)